MMDLHGIEISILSIRNSSALLFGPKAGAMTRRVNEEFVRIIERHPGLFGAFAIRPQRGLDAMTDQIFKRQMFCTSTALEQSLTSTASIWMTCDSMVGSKN